MDYKPTNKDVARLENIMVEMKLDGDGDGKELEKRNAAETNYP